MHQRGPQSSATVTAAPLVLAPEQWQARQAAHYARVDAALAGHRARQERGEKHPLAQEPDGHDGQDGHGDR